MKNRTKNFIKKSIIFMFVFTCISIMNINIVNATQIISPDGGSGVRRTSPTGMFSNLLNYNPGVPENGNTEIVRMAGLVIAIIRNIAVIISVAVLIIIGIKYMVGSIEQKAEYKKTLVPYAVGCVLVAGGATIVSVIYNFGQSLI